MLTFHCLSSFPAEKWRALTPSERAFWDAKAAEAKAEHMRNNPEYRYQPTKKPAGGKNAAGTSNAPAEPGNYYRDRSSSQNINPTPDSSTDAPAAGADSPSSSSTPDIPHKPVDFDARPMISFEPYITIPTPKPIRPRRKASPKRPVGRTADYESVMMDMVVPKPPPRILAKDWVAAQVALKAKEREMEARGLTSEEMAAEMEAAKALTPSNPSPAPLVIPPPPPPIPPYRNPPTPPTTSKARSPSMETSFQQLSIDNGLPDQAGSDGQRSPHDERTLNNASSGNASVAPDAEMRATSGSPANQRPEQNGTNSHASPALGSPGPGPDGGSNGALDHVVAAPRPLHANEQGGPLLFGRMEPLPPIRPDPTPPLFGVIDCSAKSRKRKNRTGSAVVGGEHARSGTTDSMMTGTEGDDNGEEVPESDELESEGPESEDNEVESGSKGQHMDEDTKMVNGKSEEVERAEKELREVLPVGVDTTSKISLLTSSAYCFLPSFLRRN